MGILFWNEKEDTSNVTSHVEYVLGLRKQVFYFWNGTQTVIGISLWNGGSIKYMWPRNDNCCWLCLTRCSSIPIRTIPSDFLFNALHKRMRTSYGRRFSLCSFSLLRTNPSRTFTLKGSECDWVSGCSNCHSHYENAERKFSSVAPPRAN